MSEFATPESQPLRRKIGVTLIALSSYAIGSVIALPGIDASRLIADVSPLMVDTFVGRLSLFALGVTPILSIAILIELAKIAHAPLRRALSEEPAAGRAETWTFLAAILLGGVQAYFLAVAFEGVEHLVVEPGLEFRIVILVTLAAATAVIGWLAKIITRDGIGQGLWVLFAAPLVVVGLRTTAAQAAFMGDIGLHMAALTALFMLAAAALMFGLARRDDGLLASGQLLWPAILTPTIAGLCYIPLVKLGLIEPDSSPLGPFAGSPARPFVLAGVFFIVFWLRQLSLPPAQDNARRFVSATALTGLVFAGVALTGYIAVPLSYDGCSPVAVIAIALGFTRQANRNT